MFSRRLFRSLLAILALAADASCGKVQADEQMPPFSGLKYLDNGQIRLGVDLDLGGAITYLSVTSVRKARRFGSSKKAD
jgi:hypothetical protein